MCSVKAVAFAGGLTLAGLGGAHGEVNISNLRAYLLSLPISDQLGGSTTRPISSPDAFSFQAANAPREHQRPFSFGNRLFNTNWVVAPASVKSFDGLGPLFNRVSCDGCHTKDGRGAPPESGSGPMDQMLFRISVPGAGEHGGPKPVPGYGDQLSERAIGGLTPEGKAQILYTEIVGHYADGEAFHLRKPAYQITDVGYGALPKDLMISARVAPQMIGLGLLEAVPEETLLALSDPNDQDGDGISGRINTVWNAATREMQLGRFGWKAGQPDLLNQNTAAAIGDIGLTTVTHPTENCAKDQSTCRAAITGGQPEISDEFVAKLTLYTQSLAVPIQRMPDQADVKRGAELFQSMGCAACHMPTLQTKATSLAELSQQTFHPFTDLLLHDMGEGLADNRPEFEATGREWRTPPLWGLGLVPTVNGHTTLLHDGRARDFAEAILWHGAEAEKAKEEFRASSNTDRDALIEFLRSL